VALSALSTDTDGALEKLVAGIASTLAVRKD
jgi:hypothetical protein